MAFVLDASVVLAWLLPDERSAEAESLVDRAARANGQAPALLHQEVANALLQATRRRRLTPEEAEDLLSAFLSLPIAVDPTPPDATLRAGALARRHSLSVYDGCYLELAMRRAIALASFDAALRRAAAAEGLAVEPAA